MKIAKYVTVGSFACLAAALFIAARTPPAAGYEISLYHAFSPLFYVLALCSLAGGILLLVGEIMQQEASKWWLVGALIVGLSNLTFLALPIFRGYPIYGRADTLVHLGYAKDILLTGHWIGDDYYPFIHVMMASVSQTTGLPLETMAYVVILSFSTLNLAVQGLLATRLGYGAKAVALATALATPLLFSYFQTSIYPQFLGLYLFPALLYFYHKREQAATTALEDSILLLLFAFAICFLHPLTLLLAILALLIFRLAPRLYKVVQETRVPKIAALLRAQQGKGNIEMILVIVFFSWYFSFAFIQYSFKRALLWLLNESLLAPPSTVAQYLGAVQKYDFSLLTTLEIFGNRYGAIALYLALSLTLAVFVLARFFLRRRNVTELTFTYVLQFLFALGLSLALSLKRLMTTYEDIRLVAFAIQLTVPANTLAILGLLNLGPISLVLPHRWVRRMVVAFLGVFIMASSILSLFSLYGRPGTIRWNYQVTQMELVGTDWTLKRTQPSAEIVSNLFETHKFAAPLIGFEDYLLRRESIYPLFLSSHFGYDERRSIAEGLVMKTGYLILSELDRVFPQYYPEAARSQVSPQLGEADFARLNSDPDIARVYVNGDFEMWWLSSSSDLPY